MKFYILSLKHTDKEDKYITLWRPDNAGYAWKKEDAGLYEDPSLNYHDDKGNMPLSESDANRVFVNNGCGELCIPNTAKVWAALGVRKTTKGLKRLITAL